MTATLENHLSSFGRRLKDLRLRQGWTLEDLARKSGLSKPFLSRLESGNRQASISAVLTLSNVFGVSLASMFETQIALEPCLIVRGAEIPLQSGHGLTYAPLSNATHLFNLRPLRLTVPLDRKGDEHYQHEGEEWIFVLSGQLRLSLDGKTYDLAMGDAAHFDSRLPHRLIATGSTDTEVLLVSSPSSPERQKSAYPASSHTATQVIPAGIAARFLSPTPTHNPIHRPVT